MLVVTESLHVH